MQALAELQQCQDGLAEAQGQAAASAERLATLEQEREEAKQSLQVGRLCASCKLASWLTGLRLIKAVDGSERSSWDAYST